MNMVDAIYELESPKAQNRESRMRSAEKLRLSAIAVGQAKELVYWSMVPAGPRQTLQTLGERGVTTSQGLDRSLQGRAERNAERRSGAEFNRSELQIEADKIWNRRPNLSKANVAQLLVEGQLNLGLAEGTIRQRIKRPKDF